eukprot:1519906-Amphidinium_carterae.1
MLAAITKLGSPSNPSGRNARPISSAMSVASAIFNPSGGDETHLTHSNMSSTVSGEPTPLPSPEDQAGALVVVDSK